MAQRRTMLFVLRDSAGYEGEFDERVFRYVSKDPFATEKGSFEIFAMLKLINFILRSLNLKDRTDFRYNIHTVDKVIQ